MAEQRFLYAVGTRHAVSAPINGVIGQADQPQRLCSLLLLLKSVVYWDGSGVT